MECSLHTYDIPPALFFSSFITILEQQPKKSISISISLSPHVNYLYWFASILIARLSNLSEDHLLIV
ncbi:hypothetical protein AAC387_Pa11g0043 [Persea americana]